MRFHLDENLSRAISTGLRRRGLDVTTTVDAGLRGASDLDQLEYARASIRVLVTHDSDFLRHNATGIPHAGIIYCPSEKYSIGDLIRLLLLIDELYSDEELRQRVEYL